MGRRTKLTALAYGALAVTDTMLARSEHRFARKARFVTKPLLMPTLGYAFAGGTTGRSTLRTATLVAQGFSGGGDVALLGKGEKPFLAGLGSFFAAHIAYVAAFAGAGRPLSDRSADTGTKVAAGLWLTTGPAMAYAAGRSDPKLRVPVAAYSAILSAMVATSTRLDTSLPRRARWTVVAGTALFMASDTILGTREFVLKSDSHALDAAVMGTYTAAQGLIAAGIAQAVNSQP